jgi:hypothetical protein
MMAHILAEVPLSPRDTLSPSPLTQSKSSVYRVLPEGRRTILFSTA